MTQEYSAALTVVSHGGDWPVQCQKRYTGSLDVCFINSLPVLQGFPWERHAPAWLPELGWSPAFPGGHWRRTYETDLQSDADPSYAKLPPCFVVPGRRL